MHLYICIDDTDTRETIGTGKLAARLIETIEKQGFGTCGAITRHQLYVHPDVPYTSHNSAMCFPAEIESTFLEPLISHCGKFLEEHSAAGSDPGLCVVVTERLTAPDRLIAFGKLAKTAVLQKKDAYTVARELNIHLSEHGGTGQGVIGALAGTGLRLTGNDGRFRGKHQISGEKGIATVGSILQQANIDLVRTVDGEILAPDVKILLGEKIKSILQNHQSVLLVQPSTHSEAKWETCPKEYLKQF
ncbi:MAG TPA: hypothetical protein GX699_03420 [Firmicutes bacterium]|nr:hypothetical protein [Bacillota bacterium]